MKVVILAGGYGTRIGEESQFKPKPMIEIGGKPILWHIMKEYSHYGFNEFVICAGYRQHMIKQWFADYFLRCSDITFDYSEGKNEMIIHQTQIEPWKVTVVDTGLNTMTGGRVKRIQKFVGEKPFYLTYGDAVSDALLIDAVAEPDDNGRTCHKCENDDKHCKDAEFAIGVGNCLCDILELQEICSTHERGKTECDERSNRIELLSSFLAFLLETFQRRKRIGQKLNNDARIDVRRNAEREHGCFCKRAAGEDIQVLKEVSVACLFLHPRGHDAGIKERNRDDGSKTENHDDEQSEQNLLSDLGDTPSSLERFEHLTSPQPSRLPFRFFLLRKQRTSLPERSA